MNLKDRTLLVTGASRGIGLAIALRAARDGANIVLLAKTVEPNPKLPGTLASAAAEIEAAGGQALPVQTDIRDEAAVTAAVQAAVERFGGIDILVNNASAISLTSTPDTPIKRFDLMFGVNVRGTYLCTQQCLPHLIKSAHEGRNPHVLNMSPPLSMKPHWFRNHVAYTMAKYGMSECTLGHAAEFASSGIGVNSLSRAPQHFPLLCVRTALAHSMTTCCYGRRLGALDVVASGRVPEGSPFMAPCCHVCSSAAVCVTTLRTRTLRSFVTGQDADTTVCPNSALTLPPPPQTGPVWRSGRKRKTISLGGSDTPAVEPVPVPAVHKRRKQLTEVVQPATNASELDLS